MAAVPQRMNLVIDEHIPPLIVAFLRQRGHTAHLVTQSTIKGAADEVVCVLADQQGAIVTTFNHNHYEKLLPRIPQARALRFPNTGRISFRGSADIAMDRLQAVIEDIEDEFRKTQSREDRRLLVTIEKTRFVIER